MEISKIRGSIGFPPPPEMKQRRKVSNIFVCVIKKNRE